MSKEGGEVGPVAAVGGLFSAIVGMVLGPVGGPFVALGVTALKGAAIIRTAGQITVTVHSTRACAELNALSP